MAAIIKRTLSKFYQTESTPYYETVCIHADCDDSEQIGNKTKFSTMERLAETLMQDLVLIEPPIDNLSKDDIFIYNVGNRVVAEYTRHDVRSTKIPEGYFISEG
jgi:hypothetical protein